MPAKKLLLTFLLALSIIVLGLGIYLESHSTQPQTEPPQYKQPTKEDNYAKDVLGLDFNQQTPPPLFPEQQQDVVQTGWIPDWDLARGMRSLERAGNKFESISPVWYYLESNGAIRANRTGLTELKRLRAEYGIKIIPSVASFSAQDFHGVLSDSKKLDEHINFFIDEVERHDLDGIDLDYETMRIEDQAAYLRLVRELYTYLDSKGKKLTIAVISQHSYNNPWKGAIQTRRVQNWHTLGMYSHEIRIMTYNFTGNRSKYPGPIAPLDWMEATLRYARTQIDADKIFLGVHQYAYGGWEQNPSAPTPYLSPFENPRAPAVTASALEYIDILQRKRNTISDKYNKELGESILIYRKDGKRYIAYYIDARGVAARKRLAQKYGIKGVAYWRLGGEDVSSY